MSRICIILSVIASRAEQQVRLTDLSPNERFEAPDEFFFSHLVEEFLVGRESPERIVADLCKHGTRVSRPTSHADSVGIGLRKGIVIEKAMEGSHEVAIRLWVEQRMYASLDVTRRQVMEVQEELPDPRAQHGPLITIR